MKVLLSCYACEPGRGSEPCVGWNTAREVAKYHEVWALTRSDHRPRIEDEMQAGPIPSLHFVYYDNPSWSVEWKKGGLGLHLHYMIWQIWAYCAARKLHRSVHFDVVHHVTYCRYWTPSYLALLPIPFVWGPVGGADSAPLRLYPGLGLRGTAFEIVRDLARRLAEYDPFVRLSARRSSIAIAATPRTAGRITKLGAKVVRQLSQCGLTDEELAFLGTTNKPAGIPFRFISLGQLLPLKGFHLGLRAFAEAHLEAAEYWIIGDGPERKRLQDLAARLEIAKQVRFFGWKTRPEAWRMLRQCHVLVHPSLHDSGGFVCLEAMAAGCPVICLDIGGPGVAVAAETGIKVSPGNPEQVISRLSAAMIRLARDPQFRSRLRAAGQAKVCELHRWELKGRILSDVYREVGSRPGGVGI